MRSGGIGSMRVVQAATLAAVSLALANCSGGVGGIDPRYGVSASPRVIADGQPVPKGGGVYRVGKPYVVAGRVYVPEVDPHYSAVGLASWYGHDFHGRYTANGEIFDKDSISAAHPTLPLPSYARVTNLSNNKSIIVRVNDRGPYAYGRLIDVSVKTAHLLGFHGNGTAKVKVEYVGMAPLAGSDDRKLMATLREGAPAEPPSVQVASANGSFAPAYFDRRRTRRVAPIPAERPYNLGETESETAPELASADATQSGPAQQARAPAAGFAPASILAPERYSAPAGFMSGRGLY
jgi:peptidoglycan lytic transglycosylase